MGVIVKEEYVCDVCQTTIEDGDEAQVGQIVLRKVGARGMGRTYELALHAHCADQLGQHAKRVVMGKHPRQK